MWRLPLGTRFLQVAVADGTLTAARANVERLEVFANSARTRVQNQRRAGTEPSSAEAEMAEAKNRVIEAERTAAWPECP